MRIRVLLACPHSLRETGQSADGVYGAGDIGTSTGDTGQSEMSSKRVLLLFGTRPEAIKMCPLVRAIEQHPGLNPLVAVTGQHREMLDQMLDLFGIAPQADLGIHQQGQSLGEITTRILTDLPPLLRELSPDVVVVQGDTTTTFAAALAATYAELPVVHLEAGLRSGNRWSPYPEEVNRCLTSQLATLHLAATPANRAALLAEAIQPDDIVVTGNTVIDALLEVAAQHRPFDDGQLRGCVAGSDRRLVLVTAHRRESWGAPLTRVASAVADTAASHPDTDFVWPLHANPLVRDAVLPAVGDVPNIVVTDPLGYPDFTGVLARAHVALTDSGGVQEEAPALGVPVLVTREVTERAEVVDVGAARLVGTDGARVRAELGRLLTDPDAHGHMRTAGSPYGDGHAAGRAAAAIARLAGVGTRLAEFTGGVRGPDDAAAPAPVG